MRAFAKRVEPMLDMAKQQRMQSQTLTALRDMLLPKLLSGEIRVGQAEKTVEEVL